MLFTNFILNYLRFNSKPALFCFIVCVDKRRFGVNCTTECHCADVEDCQKNDGQCHSDCTSHFVGFTCQGNALFVLTALMCLQKGLL